MGKGHRDNHEARVKRGAAAFAKKAERREPESKCNLCGTKCRPTKLEGGLCPVCRGVKDRAERPSTPDPRPEGEVT